MAFKRSERGRKEPSAPSELKGRDRSAIPWAHVARLDSAWRAVGARNEQIRCVGSAFRRCQRAYEKCDSGGFLRHVCALRCSLGAQGRIRIVFGT